MKYIWIRNKRYYLYDTFNTWNKAKKVANYYKKKIKGNQYYIIKSESGFLVPTIKYKLYMTKVFNLW